MYLDGLHFNLGVSLCRVIEGAIHYWIKDFTTFMLNEIRYYLGTRDLSLSKRHYWVNCVGKLHNYLLTERAPFNPTDALVTLTHRLRGAGQADLAGRVMLGVFGGRS